MYPNLQKSNFIGSALYIAAHPDDENTRMISYLVNDIHANTAYLSLTRGDGGQNLIGPELRELLGVIRTEELMEAFRRIGVYPKIEEWRDRLRQCFSSGLLNPLLSKIENSHSKGCVT